MPRQDFPDVRVVGSAATSLECDADEFSGRPVTALAQTMGRDLAEPEFPDERDIVHFCPGQASRMLGSSNRARRRPSWK
jgi:hypothetical protein